MANPVLTKTFKNQASNNIDVLQTDNTNMPYMNSSVVSTRMTMEGVINKILVMFGLLIAAAAVTWFSLPIIAANDLVYPILLGSLFAGLGISLYISFSKKVRKGAMFAYAAVEGVFIGIFSGVLEALYSGIVFQAVLGTLATAGTIFFAWKVGWIKITDKFMKYMMFALVGYLVFGLINLGFALFAGMSVYSSPVGWLIALLGCGLAAFSLAMDFQLISRGIADGAPEEYEWRGAFGLTVTLVWLYLEILRLLSIFRQ